MVSAVCAIGGEYREDTTLLGSLGSPYTFLMEKFSRKNRKIIAGMSDISDGQIMSLLSQNLGSFSVLYWWKQYCSETVLPVHCGEQRSSVQVYCETLYGVQPVLPPLFVRGSLTAVRRGYSSHPHGSLR